MDFYRWFLFFIFYFFIFLNFVSLFGQWRWFGFSGREVKIRERREMGENRYGFGIYYFIG